MFSMVCAKSLPFALKIREIIHTLFHLVFAPKLNAWHHRHDKGGVGPHDIPIQALSKLQLSLILT